MRVVHLLDSLVNIFQLAAVRQALHVNRTLIWEVCLHHILHVLFSFSISLLSNRNFACALLDHLFCNGIVYPLLLLFLLQNSVEVEINQLLVSR
jgi:hypothetical protein